MKCNVRSQGQRTKPKCCCHEHAQVLTKGHKQHLEHCTGKPPRPAKHDESDDEDLAEDEEELAEVEVSKVLFYCTLPLHANPRGVFCSGACLGFKGLPVLQEAERIQRLDDKLKSLQMNGLIELTDKAAKYSVSLFCLFNYTNSLRACMSATAMDISALLLI